MDLAPVTPRRRVQFSLQRLFLLVSLTAACAAVFRVTGWIETTGFAAAISFAMASWVPAEISLASFCENWSRSFCNWNSLGGSHRLCNLPLRLHPLHEPHNTRRSTDTSPTDLELGTS